MAEQHLPGQCGRPKYILPQAQLEFLVERRFSVSQISKLPLERWKYACPYCSGARSKGNPRDPSGLTRCIADSYPSLVTELIAEASLVTSIRKFP